MKIKNVPQDKDPSYEGATKLCYAMDEQGQFIPVTTNGWHVEETVKGFAWQSIEKDLRETRLKIRQGKLSPLSYFMKLRQMDPQLLALNMGISSLRVRWHLRPRVFRKLDETWLRKYSECLEVPAEALKDYQGSEDSDAK